MYSHTEGAYRQGNSLEQWLLGTCISYQMHNMLPVAALENRFLTNYNFKEFLVLNGHFRLRLCVG